MIVWRRPRGWSRTGVEQVNGKERGKSLIFSKIKTTKKKER